jgi:hypothetical protein
MRACSPGITHVEAAIATFRTKGVAVATVDDIVSAVAERMIERIGERVGAGLGGPDQLPEDAIRALGAAIRDVGAEPHERELIDVLHQPANRAMHDRISEHVVARLAPAVTTVVPRGIEQGAFVPQDPGRTAAFVLACYGALHSIVEAPTPSISGRRIPEWRCRRSGTFRRKPRRGWPASPSPNESFDWGTALRRRRGPALLWK